MTLLQLEYQGRVRPFPWAGTGLLLIALAVSAQVGVYYHELNEKNAYWAHLAETNKRQLPVHPSVDPRRADEIALEIKYANGVLNKLTLPWDKLFQAVEWSSGKNVALLGIEPDADKHELRITAEARNLGALTQYIRQLSRQEIFTSVYLQSHQIQQQIPERPVRFTLVAGWKAAP